MWFHDLKKKSSGSRDAASSAEHVFREKKNMLIIGFVHYKGLEWSPNPDLAATHAGLHAGVGNKWTCLSVEEQLSAQVAQLFSPASRNNSWPRLMVPCKCHITNVIWEQGVSPSLSINSSEMMKTPSFFFFNVFCHASSCILITASQSPSQDERSDAG